MAADPRLKLRHFIDMGHIKYRRFVTNWLSCNQEEMRSPTTLQRAGFLIVIYNQVINFPMFFFFFKCCVYYYLVSKSSLYPIVNHMNKLVCNVMWLQLIHYTIRPTFYVGLITHPDESFRVWSWSLDNEEPWPTGGYCAMEKIVGLTRHIISQLYDVFNMDDVLQIVCSLINKRWTNM